MKPLVMAAVFSLAAGAASALELTIDGTDSIYGAGLGGNGVSTAATEFNFVNDVGTYITASYISGTTGCCGTGGGTPAGADGQFGLTSSGSTNIAALNGISGTIGPTQMFLVGVFVDSSSLPTSGDTPPATIDFNTFGTAFTSLMPELNQSFWIGDGLTGSGTGTIQQFIAPDDADRLLLGFSDGFNFFGLPSYYGDNPGSLTMDINAITPDASVPLPAGLPLLLAGLGGLAALRRRR